MTPTTIQEFPPLQSAIAQAESWTRFLNESPLDARYRSSEENIASLESSILAIGVKVGEMLPLTWRLTFEVLFRPGQESWSALHEFEAVRQTVHRLFFTAREALESTLKIAESMQVQSGRVPAEMARLLDAIEEARRLEEAVFRDWPSFEEPLPTDQFTDALLADESLAETLGISVEEARRRLEVRRLELHAKRG